ncbi:three-helix bundle dimerization domain-containing protein [Streptomyces sp. NPDC099088]|uniref:three-helix bundle dimerization domain-containing protein n=1 Tax=Streptomyces sp. NPDC099088 TaxID=3366101 RepID=UPI00380356DA
MTPLSPGASAAPGASEASAPSAAGHNGPPPPPTGVADGPGPSSAQDASADGRSAANRESVRGDRSQDETAALVHLATRLKAAHPTVEASVVDDTVASAHDAFREAKIRTYVPILVERRARNLLVAIEREGATSPKPASLSAPTAPPGTVPATATAFRVAGDQGPATGATGLEL